MNSSTKKHLFLSFIAFLLMGGVFVYLLIDLQKEGNTYVEGSARTKQAQKEVEVTSLLGDAKSLLDKPFITVQNGTFEWKMGDGSVIQVSGGQLVLTRVDPELLENLYEYLHDKNFVENSVNTDDSITYKTKGYENAGLVCLLTLSDTSSINIFCGYRN